MQEDFFGWFEGMSRARANGLSNAGDDHLRTAHVEVVPGPDRG